MANPTGTLNADEDHSTRKITNVAHPPVADHDAATKKYVDDNIGGGGGATVFTALTDVPASYAGQGNKLVAVLTGETGLGFITPTTSTVSQVITGGGVAWTGTGFNYIISAATYIINGTQYNSSQSSVTLTTADATQDRIDVFYVDNSGAAGVITGTPATPPVQPSVDPGSQLQLTFAYLVAASTVPVITNENIYLENAEYTMSATAGTINVASTNNPYAGTKDIEGTSVAAATFFTALKPSGTLNLSGYTQLTFQIRSKATWPNNKSISIFWLNGTMVVGASLALKQGTFGFDSSNIASYQQIVIPAANFGTAANPVNKLRMTVSGSGANIGWYIDNIILQAGGGGGGGGGTITNFTAGNLAPVFTTSVANPTTTPALTFALSTVAAHSYLGNNTGSTAAPAFHQIAYSEITGTPSAITPAALTKTDDTNVTLTLGGTPATALLQASSITAGWTGTLAQTRGGFGKSTASLTDGQIPIGKTSDSSWNMGTITQGAGITVTNGPGTITIAATAGARIGFVGFTADGGGSALSAGKAKGFVVCPYAGNITAWNIVLDTGTATIKVWKIATGTAKPTSANSINTSGVAISTGTAIRSTTLSDFTSTVVTARDIFAFNIEAISGATELSFELEIT